MENRHVYKKIENISYGELSPKIEVKHDGINLVTEENRNRIDSEYLNYLNEGHKNYPIDIPSKDLFISIKNCTIPIRIYMPESAEPLPVIIYYHGGGWVCCNIETHDFECSYIAKASASIVISVNYRLAPEFKFPIGLEDCYETLKWVNKNAKMLGGDPDRIAVAGDSSGGNLAAAVCILAKERKGPKIKRQVLIYPVVDLSDTSNESYLRYEKGYLLEREAMEAHINQYINNENDRIDPHASPLLLDDVTGLPSTLFIFAQCDVLLDEGLKYAKRLKDAGSNVEYVVYKGMPHGFVQLTYKESFDALDKISTFLKKAFIN